MRRAVGVPILERVAVADLWIDRIQLGVRGVLQGMLPCVLSEEELVELCGRLYGRHSPSYHWDTIFPWEQAWLDRYFPPAPARVLVGGAGFGRECAFLREKGYEVDAYDPNAAGVERCARVIGEGGECVVASHEVLADAVLDRRDNALSSIAGRRYDVVLLGWGSLSHVLAPARRERTIRACAELTSGPILASARVSRELPPETRSQRIGRALGARLGRRVPPPGLHYQPEHGFAATIAVDEVEALARAIGRSLVWHDELGITSLAFVA